MPLRVRILMPFSLFVLLAALWFLPVAVQAQQAEAPAAETPAAEAPSAQAPEATAASEEPPAYPPALDAPDIPLEELQIRLVPLTADELAALALAWQGLARDATQAVVDTQLEIRAQGEAAPEALRDQRLALMEERAGIFEKFAAVVSSLDGKGGDPELVENLRGYRSAIAVEETSRMDAGELAEVVIAWLVSPEGGMQLVFRVTVVLVALLGLFVVAGLVRSWARRIFSRIPNLSRLLTGFLAMAAYWLTIAFGLMIVLAMLGVNVTPLFALVGGAAFIMAFALQDTLSNLAAGLMIMINRPFDEGDYVTVAGVGGTVQHVSVVSTTVTTPDNQVIVIPNSKVWGDVITNVTASETRRVDLTFGISYDDSIEEAQAVLEEVVRAHPAVMSDPAPVIRVHALGDSSVDFIVRPWTRAEDYWQVYWDLTRQVKEAFDARGISIPYPHTEMVVRDKTAFARPDSAS